MARLNELPVCPDSLDILRRKFLRQNRDIARINSNQSLRIRGLENECARLLSENLELRGQILRLEKEAEDSSARRIADHALEIKAKLESQLAEWGSMLAGLGMEPPAKRRSLDDGRKYAKPRLSGSGSGSRSPALRRPREAPADPDALAIQEGRLAPIYENKPYPRQTMNEQILALCSEAADTSYSPDLGPPPVSRYVEEDPVKHDSPIRQPEKGEEDEAKPRMESSPRLFERISPPRKLDYNRKPPTNPEPEPEPEPEMEIEAEPEPEPAAPLKEAGREAAQATVVQQQQQQQKQALSTTAPTATASTSPPKTGAKRKYGDENEGVINKTINRVQRVSASTKDKEKAPTATIAIADQENDPPARALQKRRSIKDLSANRREKAGLAKPTPTSTRMPLSAKSTNEDVSSPKKSSSAKAAPPLDEIKAAKALVHAAKDAAALPREKTVSAPKQMATVDVPDLGPPPPRVTTIVPDPDVPTNPSPDTPIRSTAAPPPQQHDMDCTSHDEAARPGRRARASISYAEPSLRDKMRRPTKELFDAVAGEGKYIHRPQTAGPKKPDDATATTPAAPSSNVKIKAEPSSSSDNSSSNSWKNLPAHNPPSPLARHSLSPPPQAATATAAEDTLPTSVVTDRRRRPSSIHPGPGTGQALLPGGENKPDTPILETSSAPPTDIYDFATSSPESAAARSRRKNSKRSTTTTAPNYTETDDNEHHSGDEQLEVYRDATKPRRRASAAAPETTTTTTVTSVSASSRSRAAQPRKRASIKAVSSSSSTSGSGSGRRRLGAEEMMDEDGCEADVETVGVEKVTRRRSMMI
ncbi:hypothetical protein B0T19DRAFT_403769 [Cercophora scortea]|uniref:Shugoshin n=1 Tax=Cercophora scortea TaxID=314031 RepID=A0AAE0M6W5_9PEZI|nr:hypothetical protein B0T19DRAFT_403769 [Cercophora scortea]